MSGWPPGHLSLFLLVASAMLLVRLLFSTDKPATRELFIVRHGDKMSKYPACTPSQTTTPTKPCYAERTFGNNPELTECGRRQARMVATTLLERSTDSDFISVLSSPFMRTMQTALPLVQSGGSKLKLKVEPLLSEDRQLSAPHQPRQAQPSADGLADWIGIAAAWDRSFSSPPIPTPEGNQEYWHRMQVDAPAALKEHIKSLGSQHPGAVALFTHAGPSFSLAFGLCRNLFDNSVKRFVGEIVVSQDGIAPTGFMRAVFDQSTGECLTLEKPDNQVWHESSCGMTRPHKTSYEDNPGKYWPPPIGVEVDIVDRSGD